MKKYLLILVLFPLMGMFLLAQTCQWAEKIGGKDDEINRDITLDKDGNIYIIGTSNSDTIDFNNGISLIGHDFVYFAKYNSGGLCLMAEKINGQGNSHVKGACIAVDSIGNIFVAGIFYYDTIRFNNGIFLTNTENVTYDGFVAKYNANFICQWAERIGGYSDDYCYRMSLDKYGNMYITGYSNSMSLFFNNGISLSTDIFGNTFNFIAKYSENGICQFAEIIDGKPTLISAEITGISIDNEENIILGGYFSSDTLFFNNGIFIIGKNGDGYIAKYDKYGICQWAEKIGGILLDYLLSMTIDTEGNIFIAGSYTSDTLYFNNGISLTLAGVDNMFCYIAKYNKDGACQWAEKITTGNPEYSCCWVYPINISLFSNNDVLVGGVEHPLTLDAKTLVFNNGIFLDIISGYFIANYDKNGTCQWAVHTPGPSIIESNDSMVIPAGNFYIIGFFDDTLYFNNGIYLINSSVNKLDGFIAKYDCNTSDIKMDNTIHQEISISPCPSNNVVCIKGNLTSDNKAELIILNILGNEILKLENSEGGTFTRQVDISYFPAGIYFLKIIQNFKVIYRKFIKD